jgi:hypothetical protein
MSERGTDLRCGYEMEMLFAGLGPGDVGACLGLAGAQGMTVVLPRGVARLREQRVGPWIAAVPALGFAGVVLLLARWPDVADGVSALGSVAVPVLAGAALALMARRGRVARLGAVPALVAVAVLWRGRLVGQLAGLAITALSAAACGTMAAARVRRGLVALALVAMAALDVVLLAGGRAQMAAHAIERAHGGPLPGFAEAHVAGWHLGYADLLVAGIAGGVAARNRRQQIVLALLTLALAIGEAALLAKRTGSYPATPPVAIALVVALLAERRRARRLRHA